MKTVKEKNKIFNDLMTACQFMAIPLDKYDEAWKALTFQQKTTVLEIKKVLLCDNDNG